MPINIPVISVPSGAKYIFTASDPVLPSALPTPQNLTAVVTAGTVVLDWNDIVWPDGTTGRVYEVHEDLFLSVDNLAATVTASTRTSPPLPAGTYRYYIVAKDSSGVSAPSVKVTVTVEAPSPIPPPLPPPDPTPGNVIFDGNFSSGDFRRWDLVQNRLYNQVASRWVQNYPAQVVDDPAKGKVARFECRPGDWPGFASTSSERTEIVSDIGGAKLGETRWYTFSIKFDPSFRIDHRDLCYFAVTHQWFSWPRSIHPTIGFSYREVRNKWSMWINRQGSATPAYDPNPWAVDILPGTWHEMKMQVKWSDLDNVGFVKLWRNGIPQLFSNGTYILPGRTMCTGDTWLNHHQGIYRGKMNTSVLATDIVYHADYKVGTTEASVV